MRVLLIFTLLIVLTTRTGKAQQFIGMDTRNYSAIQMMHNNPAWVTGAETGTEFMLFSANALAGNNAFAFRSRFLFNGFEGQAVEDIDYVRDPSPYGKHLWANIEICGPAASFKYKDEHYIGFYTRARQIYRAGHINSTQLRLIGQETPDLFYDNAIPFNKAGFSTHTFSEIGFTYGRVMFNDYYNIFRGGVTVKYLMGFVAGSVYTNELNYIPDTADQSVQGDLTLLYTHNINSFIDKNAQNDLTSWFMRAGRSGLGLDIGAQYEYHPLGNPNYPTPYTFSVSASLTDIGGVGYIADTGSGSYELNIIEVDTPTLSKLDYEGINEYMIRLEQDTLLGRADKREKFRMGLPTAFRMSADYYASERFNLAVNILLNLRGNGGDRYRSAYVNYFNITPSYRLKHFSAGMPFTVIGYQTIALGANFRIGPLFFGSTSAFSMAFGSKIDNIDAYAGLVWKFKSKARKYY